MSDADTKRKEHALSRATRLRSWRWSGPPGYCSCFNSRSMEVKPLLWLWFRAHVLFHLDSIAGPRARKRWSAPDSMPTNGFSMLRGVLFTFAAFACLRLSGSLHPSCQASAITGYRLAAAGLQLCLSQPPSVSASLEHHNVLQWKASLGVQCRSLSYCSSQPD